MYFRSLITPFGAWLAMICGLPFLVASLYFETRTEIFLHESIATTGRVVRINSRSHDSDNDIDYAPVFSFIAFDGHVYTVESRNYSIPPEFSIGQIVQIRYIKDSPQTARVDSHWQLHAFEDIFGALGICFSGAGLGSLWYQRRRSR